MCGVVCPAVHASLVVLVWEGVRRLPLPRPLRGPKPLEHNWGHADAAHSGGDADVDSSFAGAKPGCFVWLGRDDVDFGPGKDRVFSLQKASTRKIVESRWRA